MDLRSSKHPGEGREFPRRATSAPASSSTSRDSSRSSRDVKEKSSSSLSHMDLLLNPSGPKHAAADDDPASSGDEDDLPGAEGGDRAKGSGGAGASGKKDRKRPCKKRRARYKLLISKLEDVVRADPFNFEFAKCQLPPSVAGDASLCMQLKERLEFLAQGLRDDGGLPLSNSAKPSTAGATGVSRSQRMEPSTLSASASHAPGALSGRGAASSRPKGAATMSL